MVQLMFLKLVDLCGLLWNENIYVFLDVVFAVVEMYYYYICHSFCE